MTVTADEPGLAGDEFYTAADDPAAAGAAPVDAPDPEAPYGYMTDPRSGERRPKKAPGRPKLPRTEQEIKAEPPPPAPAEDRPPTGEPTAPGLSDEDVPMPRAGVIAKQVNRLYRRGGKYLKILDEDLGFAVQECTHPDPDDPDMPTVGQAWENLAKNNPRIRAALLKLIKGGDLQDLLIAHAPIGIALFTKDWVQRFIPLHRAAEVIFEEDEDTEPGDLRPEDVEDMQRLAEREAARMAGKMGVKVPPGVAAAAMRQAEAMAAAGQDGGEVPPGLRRQQPRNGGTRAKRRRSR